MRPLPLAELSDPAVLWQHRIQKVPSSLLRNRRMHAKAQTKRSELEPKSASQSKSGSLRARRPERTTEDVDNEVLEGFGCAWSYCQPSR